MLENILTKLKGIYENVIDNQIDANEFLRGNLIEKLHIDSLIALQIIVEIEKCFNFIIEDDEKAIKIVDSPSFFLNAYQIFKLKGIYEGVMESQIETDSFIRGNLIERFNIDSLIALQIIVEIEKCFDFIIEDDETAIKIVNSPSYFLSTYQKVDVK